MILLMAQANCRVPTVHVGSRDETRIGDLARMLFRIARWTPGTIDPRPSPAGSVRRRLPDVTRAREMTGWEASTELEDGLRRTLAWHDGRGSS